MRKTALGGMSGLRQCSYAPLCLSLSNCEGYADDDQKK